MERRALEVGEEYLTIDIGGLKVNLYENKGRTKTTDPAYLGSVRVALWVNTKKAPEQQQGGFIKVVKLGER